jgi:hypothetical protein
MKLFLRVLYAEKFLVRVGQRKERERAVSSLGFLTCDLSAH